MIMKTEPCTLQECPPGLFLFGDCLGFKSEYTISLTTPTLSNWPEAFVVASGEVFWGGTQTHRDRAELIVQPVSSPTAAKADMVERLLEVFRSTPLHGDAGCDKMSDDEWRTVARAAIAALQSRSAEPASNRCKLTAAEPAGGEPAELPTGDPDHTDCDGPDGGGRFAHPSRPATPTNPERLVEAMAAAIDIADRLIERGHGMDTPAEWGKAFRNVAAIRAALSATPLKEEGE